MVVKLNTHYITEIAVFESSVISYGSKTLTSLPEESYWFESSVISYGSKTQRGHNLKRKNV